MVNYLDYTIKSGSYSAENPVGLIRQLQFSLAANKSITYKINPIKNDGIIQIICE